VNTPILEGSTLIVCDGAAEGITDREKKNKQVCALRVQDGTAADQANFPIVVDLSWPPKSPRDALLSSPSGRRKLQEMQNRQLDTSPTRRPNGSMHFRSRSQPQQRFMDSDGGHRNEKEQDDDNDGDDNDDDDDEETLQLKLAAIEARLKLKRLQQSKAKSSLSNSEQSAANVQPRPASALGSTGRPPSRLHSSRLRSNTNDRLHEDGVQVPLSPPKRTTGAPEPHSPRRFLLGIDKGLKGKDISLRRPPSSTVNVRPGSSFGVRGGTESRASDGYGSFDSWRDNDDGPRRTKTFSEKIAESRSLEKSRQARAEKIQKNRSTAFQFDQAEMESFKGSAVDRPTTPPVRTQRAQSFSRDDVLRACHGPLSSLRRSKTISSLRGNDLEASTLSSQDNELDFPQKQQPQTTRSQGADHQNSISDDKTDVNATDASKFEPYSSLHLSNRILPHSFVSRTLASKTILRIPDLLKSVRAPEFELPEIEGDYVVLGVVASKSTPRERKDSKKVTTKEVDLYDDGLNNTNKYMAITLTDLKWTVDLFLFETAFPRYYKLSEGILIAILNPNIMPPPPNKIDTNRFSLAISSSDDTILEVGFARDIGFCKAVRKDGKTCQSWVDARKTEFCDYHVDVQIRRTQSQRMGVNGTGMFGPGGRSGSRTGFFGKGKTVGHQQGLKSEGAQYAEESQSTYYIAPGPRATNASEGMFNRRSAAKLIDADDDPFLTAGMNGRGMDNKEERFRRRLADRQRERDITEKLGSKGSGLGAEYLRAQLNEDSSLRPNRKADKEPNGMPSSSNDNFGLTSARRAADTVRLSPLKRSRDEDKPRGGAKKTRFITSKGIREAGRDSLGGSNSESKRTTAVVMNDDNDDDELDII
jgi:minichromosome maintenance protein 10